MSKSTDILDDILYGDGRPWLELETSDEKYFSLKEEIKEMIPQIPLRFEIEFPRPSTNKTKYFHRLISNAVVEYSYRIISLIKEDDNENLVKYYLNDILNKHLKNRLRELGNLIKEKDFASIYISRNYVPSSEDKNHQDNTYIIQFLKLAYMQIYLEVQEEFKTEIEDILIPEDFYTQLLLEVVPTYIPISKVKVIDIEQHNEKKAVTIGPSVNLESPSFYYKKFQSSPENITDLWNNFKLNQWIPQETPLPTFRKIFSGKEIANPIKWLGNISELFYFIKLIYTVEELVERVGQRNWEITCNCFVDKNGNRFDRAKFKNQKIPVLSKSKIEKAVELLK